MWAWLRSISSPTGSAPRRACTRTSWASTWRAGAEYTEVVPGQRIVAQVHFFAEKPTWTFTFAPVKGGTKVTAEGEWQVGLPVAGGRIEGMMVKQHEPFLDEMLASLKSGVEAKAAA
jgi:hypothetical protein